MGNEIKVSHFSVGQKTASALLSAALFATTFLSVGTIATVGTAPTVSAANEYGLAENIQDGAILHCFDWKYSDIKAELPNIAKAGFTAVQTSPAQVGGGSGPWWWLYQPLGFYVGTNALGTKDELQALCDEAENYGIKVVVDVVANHLAGDHSNIQSDLKDSQYWHNASGGIDYSNRWQITHRDIGMADINSEHTYVQQVVRKYIDELKSMGVDGIRWDAAKHISLPSESCNFWPAVVEGSGLWHYGEILDDPVANDPTSASSLMQEYSNYISVTDSGYCATVRMAFRSGGITTSIGNYSERGVSKDKLVYWAESHDTYSNNNKDGNWDSSQFISQNKIDRAYAVVASQGKAAALYFSRPSQTNKDSIIAGEKGSTHFTSKEVAAVNHFKNAMIGQKEYDTTGNDCIVICREKGAVIVSGGGSNIDVTVPNGGGIVAPGTYTDEITGSTWTVTSTTISGRIGDTGIAVVYNPGEIVTTPYASATPGDSTFTDSLSVKLSFSNAVSGNYTTSEGASGSFTNGQTITIGQSTAVGGKVTLTVTATNDKGETSTPKTYTYTKKDPSAVTTVYFDNSTYNWSSVYAYIYTGDGSTASEVAAWPGTAMTKDASTGYYSIAIPEGFENGKVIFTESQTATTNRYPADQQPGLDIGGSSKLFSAGNSWKDYTPQPPIPQEPSITASVASGSSFKTETMNVTLTLNNATSGTYSIDGNAPTTFTGSKTITIGEGKISDTTVKVVVTATDGTETVTETLNYSKVFDQSVDYNTAASSLASQYSTNSKGVGVKKTISIDGSLSDWDSSMLIAQGAANDDPRVYRDNSMYELPIDLYALYAAYDDNNLYLMWEMTNVQDVVAPNDDYPLSQGILWQTQELPFFIAIDTGKSDTIGNNGALQTSGTIWDSGLTIANSFNRLISINTKGGNGPFVYGGDSSGLNPVEMLDATTSNIKMNYGLGILSSSVIGINGAYGSYNGRVVGDVCNNSADWVDFNTLEHSSSTMDFFYEMSIPYSELGITLSDVQNNGIGVLLLATFGKSAMDCLPYDTSMNDNADLPDTESQANNSFEKSDEDYVTCAFARVGSGSGPLPPDPSNLVVNFGASLSAPQATGTSMTLSAVPYNATGTCTYKFSVNGTVVQNSTNSSVSWTPSKTGVNTISVTVTDGDGNTATVSKKFTVTGPSIIDDVEITSFTATNTNFTLGNSTTLKTTATGSNLQYKYAYTLNGTSWTVIKAYSATSSYTWTPSAAGTYTVRAFVTDGTTTAKKDITVKVTKSATVTISSFTATSTNVTLGNSTTLKTTATGSNLKYKYAYTTGSGWTVIKAYSTTSSYAWKPTAAGTYTVRAFVTNGTTTAKKDITIKVTKPSSSLAISSLKSFSENDTANLGDTVKFGVTATGTTSATQYKFEYTRTGTTWATIQDYSTSRYPTWIPKYAGTYTIKVTAKDGTNTATKTMSFTVEEAAAVLGITSFTSSKTTVTSGSSVTLKAVATGSNLQYRFICKSSTASSWSAITSSYSSSASTTWKPTTAGTYTVRVYVTDGTDTVYKDITVKVS